MARGVYKHLGCLLLGLVKRNRNQTLMLFKKKYIVLQFKKDSFCILEMFHEIDSVAFT